MRNLLSNTRGMVVDEFRKKRVYAYDLTTHPARSIFCRVDKLPTFTTFRSHILQVLFHSENQQSTSVNSILLPTTHTPNKSDNKLNNLYYC